MSATYSGGARRKKCIAVSMQYISLHGESARYVFPADLIKGVPFFEDCFEQEPNYKAAEDGSDAVILYVETYQKFHEDVLKAYEEWRAFRSGATGFYFQDLTRYAVEDWSQKYWEKKPNTIKIGIVLLSNYLQDEDLLELGTMEIAEKVKGKTTEEIREQFNIENDFTPEELAAIQPDIDVAAAEETEDRPEPNPKRLRTEDSAGK